MITDSKLSLHWPVIGSALVIHLQSTPTLNLADPSTYIFKVTNSLPSSSTTNPKTFSERFITVPHRKHTYLLLQDEPITTRASFLTLAGLTAYLSLSCAAYGSVWRTATITTTPEQTPLTAKSSQVKDKVHFSYESSPSFFLQSGSIVTSTSPGFSGHGGHTHGGQKMVKLGREEVGWVHDMLVSVWIGLVVDPRAT